MIEDHNSPQLPLGNPDTSSTVENLNTPQSPEDLVEKRARDKKIKRAAYLAMFYRRPENKERKKARDDKYVQNNRSGINARRRAKRWSEKVKREKQKRKPRATRKEAESGIPEEPVRATINTAAPAAVQDAPDGDDSVPHDGHDDEEISLPCLCILLGSTDCYCTPS